MPSLTVRDIPDDVYRRLRNRAERHHRSMNGELLSILERALESRRLTAEEILTRASALRQRIAGPAITNELLAEAKEAGRP